MAPEIIMKRKIISLLILSFFFCACENPNTNHSAHDDSGIQDNAKDIEPNTQLGNWHVFSYSLSPIVALDDSAISVYSRKEIILKENVAILFDDTCSTPHYKTRKISPDELAKEYSTNTSTWNLDSQAIYMIDLGCESITTCSDFVISNNVLTVLFDGVFFHARRRDTNSPNSN